MQILSCETPQINAVHAGCCWLRQTQDLYVLTRNRKYTRLGVIAPGMFRWYCHLPENCLMLHSGISHCNHMFLGTSFSFRHTRAEKRKQKSLETAYFETGAYYWKLTLLCLVLYTETLTYHLFCHSLIHSTKHS